MNPQVTSYLTKSKKWRPEMEALRKLLLTFPLTEEVKWGKPCYSLNGRNVVLIIPFKERCILLLTKGALLDDPKKILHQPSAETQSARQIPFTSLAQIKTLEPALKGYLRQAIENEKAGREVTFKKIAERPLPAELAQKLKSRPDLKKSWAALTPGRRRAYLIHFSSAKQPATREARIEKALPQILKGVGHNEEYKSKPAKKP